MAVPHPLPGHTTCTANDTSFYLGPAQATRLFLPPTRSLCPTCPGTLVYLLRAH